MPMNEMEYDKDSGQYRQKPEKPEAEMRKERVAAMQLNISPKVDNLSHAVDKYIKNLQSDTAMPTGYELDPQSNQKIIIEKKQEVVDPEPEIIAVQACLKLLKESNKPENYRAHLFTKLNQLNKVIEDTRKLNDSPTSDSDKSDKLITKTINLMSEAISAEAIEKAPLNRTLW